MDRQALNSRPAEGLDYHLAELGHAAVSDPQSLSIELLGQTIFFCRNVSEGACSVNQHHIIRMGCNLLSHPRDLIGPWLEFPALVG